MFLFWDPTEKAWHIATTLGGSAIKFKTAKNSRAKCPADPENFSSWLSSGTMSFHKDTAMKIVCL
jgi:hypothetical protein